MKPQARLQKWSLLLQTLIVAACLPIDSQAAQLEGQGEPFNSFRALDVQLSSLEAQFQDFESKIEETEKIRDPERRAAAYKNLRRSKTTREIRSTVSSIRTTTRGLASRDRMRKSRYGRVIARALNHRATIMQRSLDRVIAARTRRQLNSSLPKFSNAMLGFVLQFQAVSGGYGALQCAPGDWTCCGPKKAQAKGALALNGCRWLCVKRARGCRFGCLGPQTPVPVHRKEAIQERKLRAAPKPPSP
jgi:hypothetical protein